MQEIVSIRNKTVDNLDLGKIGYIALPGLRNEYKFPISLSDKSEFIIQTVCDWFKVTREDLVSKNRKRKFVEPRQIAIFLVRRYTNLPVEEIGDKFGERHHTTALHSTRTVQDLMSTNQDYRSTVQAIEIKIQ